MILFAVPLALNDHNHQVDPSLEAILAELDTHCEFLGMPHLDKDEYLLIRQNLADGVVRGLVVISVHQKMRELQMDEFFSDTIDQLFVG